MMRRAVKTRKIDYDTAVSLFKRQFDELKKSIEKTGLASDWVDNKPMITDKTNFIPAGTAEGMGSKCKCFQGFFITNEYGAIKCALADSPLPGAIYNIVCSDYKRKSCPLYENRDIAKRCAEDGFVEEQISKIEKTRGK